MPVLATKPAVDAAFAAVGYYEKLKPAFVDAGVSYEPAVNATFAAAEYYEKLEPAFVDASDSYEPAGNAAFAAVEYYEKLKPSFVDASVSYEPAMNAASAAVECHEELKPSCKTQSQKESDEFMNDSVSDQDAKNTEAAHKAAKKQNAEQVRAPVRDDLDATQRNWTRP